jgi:hypothetical protein
VTAELTRASSSGIRAKKAAEKEKEEKAAADKAA